MFETELRLRRPVRVERLPDRVCNEVNARHLLGPGAAFMSQIEEALHWYDREHGLLDLVNTVNGWDVRPSLRLNVSGLWGLGDLSFDAFAFETNRPIGVNEPKFQLCMRGGSVQLIECSLAALVSGWPCVSDGHTVYAHTMNHAGGSKLTKTDTYVGVTKRSWSARFREHLAAAKGGSEYAFHRWLREAPVGSDMTNRVLVSGVSFEAAMNTEEALVAELSLFPTGLNMIPGGFAGIRYLAARGFNCGKQKLEYKHKMVEAFRQHCARTGQGNPLASAYWRDDEYAASVICSNPRNFSKEQVARVRMLDSFGKSAEEIAAELNCSELRVRRLVTGSTYRRVSIH